MKTGVNWILEQVEGLWTDKTVWCRYDVDWQHYMWLTCVRNVSWQLWSTNEIVEATRKLSVQKFSNFVKPHSVEAFMRPKTLWIQRILETVSWKRRGVPSRNVLPWHKLYTFQQAHQTWNAWSDLRKAFGTHGREQKYFQCFGGTVRQEDYKINWNANLMQLGNFIDVFLARHVSGT